MKHCTRYIVSLLFGIFSLCAYSQTLLKLADQIADADRVVAYNWMDGSTCTLMGRGAIDVIRAVSTAERLSGNVGVAPSCQIQFYRQTNLLASIASEEKWFMNHQGREEYMEKGDVLEALQRRLETNRAARRAWVDLLARDLLPGDGVTNLQNWSVELLNLAKGGSFGTFGFRDRESGTNFVVSPHPKIPGWAAVANRAPYMPEPDVLVHFAISGHSECVFITWGTDVPYGLAVASAKYNTPIHAWYSTNCAPGVYAFHRRD